MAQVAAFDTEKILTTAMDYTNRSWKLDDLTTEFHDNFHLEMVGRPEDGSKYDGMQIIFEDGVYEVSEYQAGPNENELWIYKETKSLKIALRFYMRGNNQKPIKIWD
jgi:hypothetical protein